MGKKAIFCYGTPLEREDKKMFEQNCDRNLSIMSEIAKVKNYEFNIIPFSKLYLEIKEKEIDLIYFTGHGNNFCISNLSEKLDSFFEILNKDGSKKIVILDACTKDYISKTTFPQNIKVLGAEKIYDSRSLAKILYDAVLCRNNELEDLTKQTFKDMTPNYSWVNVKN
jgi:hypothetical protein